MSLSCPVGSVLDADVSEIMCSSSLQWSPSPSSAHCKAGTVEVFQLTVFSVQEQHNRLIELYLYTMYIFIFLSSAPSAPSPPSGLQCKPWEDVGKTECVCKMPSQCP